MLKSPKSIKMEEAEYDSTNNVHNHIDLAEDIEEDNKYKEMDCEVCDKRFPNLLKLVDHTRKEHNGPHADEDSKVWNEDTPQINYHGLAPNIKLENDKNILEIELPSLVSFNSKDANKESKRIQIEDEAKEHNLVSDKEEKDAQSIFVRKRQVSGRQLNILWEFLNSHRNIAVAYNRSLRSKEYSKKQWLQISKVLNAQGDGTQKDWRGWSKYWVDYKAKLKKKAAAIRRSHSSPEGGPSTQLPLTEIERKFFITLGDDFGQGLQGVTLEPSIESSTSTPLSEFRSPSPMNPTLTCRQVSPTEAPAASISPPLPKLPSPPRSVNPYPSLTLHPDPQAASVPRIVMSSQQDTDNAEAAEKTVDAPERRAEAAEKRAKAAEMRAEAAERRAETAETRAEAAERRAETAEKRAEAAIRSAQALETIAQSLRVIERSISANAAIPRSAE